MRRPAERFAWLSRLTAADLAILGGVFLVALAIRLWGTMGGGGLDSYIVYDDGIYYAVSVAFIHGLLPYRDVMILHPPGIVLILSPFALLGGLAGDPVGFAAARVAFMTLGAVNAVLVALIAMRWNRTAALVAGGIFAVWYGARFGDRTTELMAPQAFLLLLALLLVWRRNLTIRAAFGAGLAIGVCTAIQLWGVIPSVVLGVGVLWTARRDNPDWIRIVLGYVSGVLGGGVAVCLPFFIAAPRRMFELIVLDQLGRNPAELSLTERLRMLEGFPTKGFGVPPAWLVIALAGLLAVAIVIAVWRIPATRLWVAIMAFEIAFLLRAPSQFLHYTGWFAPLLALTLGVATAAALRWILVRAPRWGRLTAAVPAAGLLALAAISATHLHGTALPLAALDQELAGARCVTADSAALLLLTDTFRRNIANGCAVVTSTSTSAHHYDPGASRPNAVHYQRAMAKYYAGGDAFLFIQLDKDKLTLATRTAITDVLPKFRKLGPVGMALPATADVACDPAYPDVCLPSPPPDVKCGDLLFRRFAVVQPDPHDLDGDRDGVACRHIL